MRRSVFNGPLGPRALGPFINNLHFNLYVIRIGVHHLASLARGVNETLYNTFNKHSENTLKLEKTTLKKNFVILFQKTWGSILGNVSKNGCGTACPRNYKIPILGNGPRE